MKFLEKLKELKNRKNDNFVELSVSPEDFNNIENIDLYDIVKTNDIVIFKVRYIDYLKIKKNNCYRIRKNEFQFIFFKNRNKIILSLLLIFFILLIFSLNQFFIRKIEFKDDKYYNEQVYRYVLNNAKKIGNVYLFKQSINDISVELRKRYYRYSYIGLVKKGSKVIIEIEIESIKSENISSDNLFGEFISKSDGIIENVKIESGNVLVRTNDVVKKDQILVTSNLLYNENLFNKDKIVPLKGYIIARIKTYKNVRVLKEEDIKIITNINEKKLMFSYNDNKKSKYYDHYYKEYNVFKIGNFSLKNIVLYRTENVKIKRNINDAIEYANYLIYIEFLNEFEYDEEKIISIDNIKIEELEEEFNCFFLVTSVQNIVSYNKNI